MSGFAVGDLVKHEVHGWGAVKYVSPYGNGYDVEFIDNHGNKVTIPIFDDSELAAVPDTVPDPDEPKYEGWVVSNMQGEPDLSYVYDDYDRALEDVSDAARFEPETEFKIFGVTLTPLVAAKVSKSVGIRTL